MAVTSPSRSLLPTDPFLSLPVQFPPPTKGMDELSAVQGSLQEAIGKAAYVQYIQLLEAFLSGRLGKGELEGALRVLLGHSLDNFDLHNKLLGLVLARLAAAETRAVLEWQRAQATAARLAGTDQEAGESFCESGRFSVALVEFSALDEQLFDEATKQTLPVRRGASLTRRRPLIACAAV